jgi:hypothetical protein
MKNLIGHLAIAIWIFGSISLIIINQKLNLNVSLKTITFPIYFPIIFLTTVSMLSDIKESFKK